MAAVLVAAGAPILWAQAPEAPSASPPPGHERMNEAFGLPLWVDESLWDDDDRAVGRRLNWREESRTRTLSGYRCYPPSSTRVLGARPYSMALYAEEGHPSGVSLFFMNKGDFEGFLAAGGDGGGSRGLRRAFDDALRADADQLAAALGALLGEPARGVMGDRTLRERVRRWDWNGHALLLAEQPGEYVALRIVPTAEADARGRAEKIGDAEIRRRLAERVKRRANGDVIIEDIPMVEQGPKGYCVPATWERYLRYLGIPADMYALAMAGETERGGGTSVRTMVENVEPLVKLYRRNVRVFSGDLSWPKLTRYLDEGIPLMWVLRLDPALDPQLTARARARAAVADSEEWNRRLAPYRREAAARRRGRDIHGHLCLIIGYNRQTNELAISDSWGREYAERWITLEEAKAVSLEQFVVIAW